MPIPASCLLPWTEADPGCHCRRGLKRLKFERLIQFNINSTFKDKIDFLKASIGKRNLPNSTKLQFPGQECGPQALSCICTSRQLVDALAIFNHEGQGPPAYSPVCWPLSTVIEYY
ncbi:hypothetical protein BT63DRAFT_25713 [Microthyrium microscopicum]|uniref:Uncharacterized protein n=1 Tax=Microthyrium microscopicum TaxID=703497 RepID=A0A6A6UU63_9PEZI|nr:hypothetical protein BT63DRAFT_25713 [Microthyrium microscopicum]